MGKVAGETLWVCYGSTYVTTSLTASLLKVALSNLALCAAGRIRVAREHDPTRAPARGRHSANGGRTRRRATRELCRCRELALWTVGRCETVDVSTPGAVDIVYARSRECACMCPLCPY
eukprot:6191060-Pleurochrysis_carterae.AAC.1